MLHRALPLLLVVSCLPIAAESQGDPLDLARLKSFTAHRASSSNPDPFSNDDSLRPIPGETVVLADLDGPGAVTHIWLTVAASEYGWPRLLRLRVYYDGSPVPSVDAPVGDFFAVGHGEERTVESLPVRDSSEGRSRNCYWPMPFARSCRITVTNEGTRRVSNLYYHVDWKRLASLPEDVAYFHARYHQELPVQPGKPYTMLAVEGEGHYVGTVLSVIQGEAGWFGEGDERMYVDGGATPVIVGTGTEDYFNDAWSLRVGHGPFAGVSVAEGTGLGSRMTAYRWHLPDPIPFKTSLRFELERALGDPEPVVRGLAAICLRDLGPAASRSLPQLIPALADPDENVRLMAANAIAAQGAGAVTAVPTLVALARSPGQHVHVLRSAATALGAIGPAAVAALPTLRELEKVPRVSWAAADAIRRIESAP